jgi:hypothetical protein
MQKAENASRRKSKPKTKANKSTDYIDIIEQTNRDLKFNEDNYYPKSRVRLVPIEKAFSED